MHGTYVVTTVIYVCLWWLLNYADVAGGVVKGDLGIHHMFVTVAFIRVIGCFDVAVMESFVPFSQARAIDMPSIDNSNHGESVGPGSEEFKACEGSGRL